MRNEIRKDYLLDRRVIIAAERARRPIDFKTKPAEPELGRTCPLCPGNERMTPPAVLLYLRGDGGVRRDKDTDGVRHTGWLVRCVSNLYPALRPDAKELPSSDKKSLRRERAVGFHLVVIESPDHDEHPGNARLGQLRLAIDAQLELMGELSAHKFVDYVQVFRNHGREAGASLSHAHTQIMTTPTVPGNVADEMKAAESYHEEEEMCAYCAILEQEKASARLVHESSEFIVIAPWASIHPFEFWILPKRHRSSILEITNSEKDDLARTLRLSLGGLARLLNDPPYNYGFHTIPKPNGEESDYYHWHLEVYPKLSVWAGFELSTGMYINVTSPELAAEELRRAVANEEARLT